MRRGRKFTSRALAALGLITAVALGAAVFFTGRLAERVLPLLASRLQLALSAEDIGGNLLTGITLRGLTLDLPAAVVRVAEARVNLRLAALLRGRFVFEEISVSSPSVVLRKSTAPIPAPPARPASGGGFSLEVEYLRLDDGLVRWAETGEYREASAIDAALSFMKGRVEIERASARIGDNILSAAGSVGLRPVDAELRLEVRGPFPTKAHVRGSTQNVTVEAFGFVEGAPWKLEARLMDGKKWNGHGNFAHLDLRRAGLGPLWLGPIAGSARFAGTGLRPAEIAAHAQWEVRVTSGPKAAGTATLADAVARWDASVTSMGLDAKITGRFGFADKRLASELKATLVSNPP